MLNWHRPFAWHRRAARDARWWRIGSACASALSVLKLPTKTALATSQMVMAGDDGAVAMVLHARPGGWCFRTGVLFRVKSAAWRDRFSRTAGGLHFANDASVRFCRADARECDSNAARQSKKRRNRSRGRRGGWGCWWVFRRDLWPGCSGRGRFLVVPALIFGGLAMERTVGTSLLVIAW